MAVDDYNCYPVNAFVFVKNSISVAKIVVKLLGVICHKFALIYIAINFVPYIQNS